VSAELEEASVELEQPSICRRRSGEGGRGVGGARGGVGVGGARRSVDGARANVDPSGPDPSWLNLRGLDPSGLDAGERRKDRSVGARCGGWRKEKPGADGRSMRGSGGRRGPRRTGARREEADAVKNCEGKGERIFILGGESAVAALCRHGCRDRWSGNSSILFPILR
jgi:hypothetical protein